MTDDELRALLGNEQQVNAVMQEETASSAPAPEQDNPAEASEIPAAESKTPADTPEAPAAAPDKPADLFALLTAPQPEEPEPVNAAAAVQKKPSRHIFLYLMLTLLVIGVLAFAVFCVIWDVRRGTQSGGYRAGEIVRVELVQNRRESTPDTGADADGRYTYAGVAEAVMPSIVEIYTYTDGTMGGTGSGIILTEDGYIATNAHVVKGATAYSVKLFDESQSETSYSAVLVGHDSKTDLAVLKISAVNLKPAVLGDSDDVHVGEEVCALGNPAGLSGSITTGIISGVNRKVRAKATNFEMDCIQTDAAISPGNSGGALVDMYGQVIGITSSKYGTSIMFGGYYEGLGFAITINQALPILKELMEKGFISGRFRIGISFYDNVKALAIWGEEGKTVPDELKGHGILIISYAEDSDLNNTALRAQDWILTMEGQEVTCLDDIYDALKGKEGGDSVHCRCARVEENGTVSTFEIDFTLLEDKSGEF